jgi:glycosyltransferase involved in cell wall biosynthesis
MESNKPIVAIDLPIDGKGGGLYMSNFRVINSALNKKYEFKSFVYDSKLGKGISIKRILNIKKQLKEINPDIVHFGGLQLAGFHMAVACKLAGIKKTVVTVHGFSGDAIGFNLFKKNLLTYIIEPLTLLFSKNIYGVSEYVESRRMIRLFAYKNIGFIYNLPPLGTENSYESTIREELGIANDAIIGVSIARITTDKGYHILDEVILNIETYADLKFIIVGQGDYLETMRKKLKDPIKNKQVFLLGYREDIDNILRGCDFFILPTLHETLSMALLEASNEKLALVASETGGVPEIIENNFNGLLVPPGNVEALKGAVLKLYTDHNLRRTFGNNAYERVKEKFCCEIIESKIDKVYQILLGNK